MSDAERMERICNLRRLGEEIDALGQDTAALANRGAISADELAAFLLDTVQLLKGVQHFLIAIEEDG